jgi:C4-dicarboxylate-specific signal transduction histidine kinase
MAISALDVKRMKLELVKVAAARAELEFRVEERMDEINRIHEHIKVQLDKEAELQAKIVEAEKAS